MQEIEKKIAYLEKELQIMSVKLSSIEEKYDRIIRIMNAHEHFICKHEKQLNKPILKLLGGKK